MRTDENGRRRLSEYEHHRCSGMGSSCEGMCEWSGSDWICHANDDQLKCHALKKGEKIGWYCTLEKKHTGDHECRANGITIVRWKNDDEELDQDTPIRRWKP